MKLDKRFVFGAALLLGLGMNISGCGDDGDDNNGNECKVTKESCEKDGKDFDKDKCECKAKAEECKVTKESCEKDGKEFDAENCRCNTVKAETCGNNKLDEGEICDTVDGEVKFADGKGTCQLWYDENKDQETAPLVNDPEAKPGCADGCTAHSMGSCKTEAKVLCGNGQIDDGEVCDIGIDGQAKTDDDVVTGKTCNDYQEGNWKEGGKPSCAKDCKSLGGGFGDTKCVSADVVEEVNGIVSCEASISYDKDSNKASGSAKVVTKDNGAVKGEIICALKATELAGAVDSNKLKEGVAGDNQYVISDEVSNESAAAGEYGCVFYVQLASSNKGVVCGENGTLGEITGKTIDDFDLVDFTIASSASADTIAAWKSFAGDDFDAVKGDGLAAKEGSDNTIVLKFIDNTSEKKFNIVKGQDSAGGQSLTALQIKDGTWTADANMSSNSHLLITSTDGYKDISLELFVKTNERHLAVTAYDGANETVIESDITIAGDSDKNGYGNKTITVGTAKEIRIYGLANDNTKALNFDDIVITSTGK